MINSALGDLADQIGAPGDALANTQNAVAKALTTGSGFVGINLESPAKLLMPFVTLLRNRLPVDRPAMGATQAQWRTQFGFGSYDFAASAGTAEAAVGADAVAAEAGAPAWGGNVGDGVAESARWAA